MRPVKNLSSLNVRKKLGQIILLSGILLVLIGCLIRYSKWLLSSFGKTDTRIFLTLNGIHDHFWDIVMYLASDEHFWIPAYALLAILIWKKFKSASWKPLLAVGLLITFTDQVSSHLIKNIVERPRPSHNPLLIPLIHLSKAGPGGLYGFVSSHAANTAALAVFLTLLLPEKKWLGIILTAWALLVAYSRIYNGVHYPSDVLFADVIGAVAGALFYLLFQIASDSPKKQIMTDTIKTLW